MQHDLDDTLAAHIKGREHGVEFKPYLKTLHSINRTPRIDDIAMRYVSSGTVLAIDVINLESQSSGVTPCRPTVSARSPERMDGFECLQG